MGERKARSGTNKRVRRARGPPKVLKIVGTHMRARSPGTNGIPYYPKLGILPSLTAATALVKAKVCSRTELGALPRLRASYTRPCRSAHPRAIRPGLAAGAFSRPQLSVKVRNQQADRQFLEH